MFHGVLLERNVFANSFYFMEDAVSISGRSWGNIERKVLQWFL